MNVVFGALVEPLAQQLTAQGVAVNDLAELERIEVIARAVSIVSIHGLMMPSQADKARRKLTARLSRIVQQEPCA